MLALSYYVAEVPALAELSFSGKEPERGNIGNIKEAIEGWLEVMEARRPFDSNRSVEVFV